MDNVHVIERPSVEPVDLEAALLHLRLDAYGSPPEHPDAPLIEALITAAREAAENFTNCRIGEWVLELRLPGFSSVIRLPDAPVQSIEAVTYIDQDGNVQTVDPALYELAGPPAAPVVRPVYGRAWPGDVRCQDDAVRVRYVTGYSTGSPDMLPEAIRRAILLIVGHLYENREQTVIGTIVSELPMGVLFMLQPYRLRMGV